MVGLLEQSQPGVNLYELVADRIASMIETGALSSGQRVPSVRKLHMQMAVSISTVLEAYRRLEARGLIEARPQSGFYVRHLRHPTAPEPSHHTPIDAATPVRISDMTLRMTHAARDPSIIPLGAAVSSPALLPMRQITQTMSRLGRLHPRLTHAYDFPPGLEELRSQVARRLIDAGVNVSPSEILTTSGAQEAVALCLQSVTQPGDTVAVESPTFYGLLQLIESLHLKAVEIESHPRDGVKLDALESAIGKHNIRACLFVLNFNNPMGSCMPDDNKRRLVEMLASRDIPLIEDDVYGELVWGAKRPLSAKAFDRKGLVLHCSSFSKTLAPGLRVGWCVPGRFYRDVELRKLATSIATASLPQMTAAEFLATGGYDRHVRRLRRTYAELSQRMTLAIQNYFPNGVRISRPSGGFVLWVEMPEGVDSLRLQSDALASKISIAPGPIFSANHSYRNCMRLNCGLTWTDEIEQAVSTLGALAGRQLE